MHCHQFPYTLARLSDPYIPQQWVKYYHNCSATMMILVLDQMICLTFKNSPEYITWRTAQVFIPLMRSLQQSLDLRCFHFLKLSILTFSIISDYVCFQYSQVHVIFFFTSCLMVFWFGTSIQSLFLFLLFHYQYGTFFNSEFHFFILVYSYRLYLSF